MRPAETFVGQPIRSLQTMLRVLGNGSDDYDRLIPDGIYGPQTTRAVAQFQRMQGLSPTGIADQKTWEALVRAYEPVRTAAVSAEPLTILLEPGEIIEKGQHSPNIHIVQAVLTVLSEAWGSIPLPTQTGTLDEKTASSLAAFQTLSALPATGALDRITWKNMALQFPLAASTHSTNLNAQPEIAPDFAD